MSESSLQQVQDTWERLAQLDPLWAVLSEPEKRGRLWVLNDFLRTGEDEISSLIDELVHRGMTRLDAALDFGCGVGRLSIPLAARFSSVTGVDIAHTMVETARSLSADRANLAFVVNERPDLSRFSDESFDLVYSNIVLQHMGPDLAVGYIREFYRVVRPGGYVVFQVPSHLRDDWLPNNNDGTRLGAGLQNAEITITDAPSRVKSGQSVSVTVVVRNASAGEWTQDLTHQINLGNHWLDASGAVVVYDDGRARLPGRLEPGASCTVPLAVTAPDSPGEHTLEVDVVQEGIEWFAQRGSPTARHRVRVEEASSEEAESGRRNVAAEYPTFMMKGIPRAEVEGIIRALDGEVLEAREHVTEWVSYRYTTRRCIAPAVR